MKRIAPKTFDANFCVNFFLVITLETFFETFLKTAPTVPVGIDSAITL